MFELMFTSFPAVIQYYLLKRRGESMTVWNMKTAVFLWAVMAFALFLMIFYFHPKTYAAVTPFRTVSVVAQTGGPVTAVHVENGQRVDAGAPLFDIEDAAQRAAFAEAEAQIDVVAAAETQALDARVLAQARVDETQAELAKLQDDLADARTLLERGTGTADRVLELETAVASAQAAVTAALAQLDVAEVELEVAIPARWRAAEAALQSAQTALDHTKVRSFAPGVVTQLALSVGAPATTLVLRPAMVIIPDRPEGARKRVAAGFNQVARTTLYEGMPAEVACEANASLSFTNAIFPARVVAIQPAVAQGQVTPSGALLELGAVGPRGTVLAYLELLHPEHEALLLDGSGCIVQTYSADVPGVFGHIVAATGVVKAAGLRLKVLGAIVSGVGLSGGGH